MSDNLLRSAALCAGLRQSIALARELIEKGKARHHVADLLNVDRVTLTGRLPVEGI
jgi:hypothetical protein